MNWTYENIVVGICGLAYLSVGVSYFIKGNAPWGMIWACYGTSNIGLIWAAISATK